MLFEDLEIIWREAESQSSQLIDDEALRRIVVERARAYRKNILRRDALEIGTNALVVTVLFGAGFWRILRDDGSFSLFSVAMFLLGLGYGCIGSFIFTSRRRQARREEHFEESIHGNLQKLLANADYQIQRQNKFIWWYLLPLAPGIILLTASTAEAGPVAPWIFGGFMCLIMGVIYWGNRLVLRKDLIPKRKELETLLADLEKNGARTVEIRRASTEAIEGTRKKKSRAFISLAVAAVGFGFVGWLMLAIYRAPEEPQVPQFDDVSAFAESDVARIDAWLQEQLERCGFPSLSVAIVRDGETVYQNALGYENTWADRKATAETAYHVASVTKAFTASLAVLLEGKGVIDLDQPVVDFLPKDVSISAQPELGATITLRQLASHTSGLPRRIPGRVQSVEGRYALEPERLYKHLAKVKLEFEPGTSELYSNLGFGLLGHALELAAGKPLDALMQELLCEPLKLERTTIEVDDNLRVAAGYATSLKLPDSHSYRRRLAGSGGLLASVGDLAKFLAAHMKPGLFTSEMLGQLHTAAELKDGSTLNRALGWSIDAGNPAGRILSKNGGRSNCGAWIGFAPEHGVGVAVATNIGEPDVDPIGRWLLERSVAGGGKPATQHGYAKVAPYTGVRWENDRPIVQVEDRWFSLVSIDGMPVVQIMEFAREEFGGLARKRFSEDLPELLSKMGHDPEWTVTLGLERKDGRVEESRIRMTEENRSLVRD